MRNYEGPVQARNRCRLVGLETRTCMTSIRMNQLITSRAFSRAALPSLLALLVALPLAAAAHAKLERSSPKDKARLTSAPKTIDLWFDELLDEKFNSIQVFPSSEAAAKSHTNYVDAEPKLDPKEKTHLSVTLKPLPPGKYTVDWRVLSRDGHSAPGRFSFEVLPPK